MCATSNIQHLFQMSVSKYFFFYIFNRPLQKNSRKLFTLKDKLKKLFH